MDNPLIELTPRAIDRIVEILNDKGLEGYGLRVGVVAGGCSGYEYSVKFVEEPTETDRVYQLDGFRLFVDAEAIEKIAGTVIDYIDGLHGAGLRFSNPQAVNTCGCGTSFSTK
ncbi:MAG: HesB/IscA family protein [Candidatus Binatia bacterium]